MSFPVLDRDTEEWNELRIEELVEGKLVDLDLKQNMIFFGTMIIRRVVSTHGLRKNIQNHISMVEIWSIQR